MLETIRNILNVAFVEIRTARRRARLWTIVFFLTLFSIVGYFIACSFLSYAATTSPSFGTGVPKYLLGNIDPTFFLLFQFAALFLMFDTWNIQKRDRIHEVLESKPVTNFEYLFGRVIGTAGLLWVVAAVNLCVMQALGLFSQVTGFGVLDTIEWVSLFNLLIIDGPATLLFWCAFVVFVASILPVRMLVVVFSGACMLGCFLLVLNTPYAHLSIVSPSSNDTLFVSDLLPQIASWSSIAIRLATVLIALALLGLGALFFQRQDSSSMVGTYAVLGVFIGLSTLLYASGSLSVIGYYAATEKWSEAHKDLNFNQNIDLSAIEGTVIIDPNRHLDLDLNVSFTLSNPTTDPFMFTFNPNMNIDELLLNGEPSTHTFENGILEIEVPASADSGQTQTMSIRAHGVPDARFAYFASAFDFLRNPNISNQVIALLGTEGSVYSPKYVALMPGVYWYPVPRSPHEDFSSARQGLDYFELDITVELTPKNWQLVATDAIREESSESFSYRVNPSRHVREIGLFASEYAVIATEVEGIEFKMYVHKLHSNNLRLLSDSSEDMHEFVRAQMLPFSDVGLTLPHQSLAFVEVPRQLRTVGGGWRMNSLNSLPGMVLMKEHGFPTARLALALRRFEKESDEEEQFIDDSKLAFLKNYFRYAVATDNPWIGLPSRFWINQISARGEHAQILDQIILSLFATLYEDEQEDFNIYSLNHFADTTALSLFEGTIGLEDASDNSTRPSTITTSQELRQQYAARPTVWNNVEDKGLSQLPTSSGHQHDLELMLLKCREIAKALIAVNEPDGVFAWLTNLLETKGGQTYSYGELLAAAEEHQVLVDPFMTDWLNSRSLPAYVASDYTTYRISDDERGNTRYQTSVSIRNTQQVAGVVRLRIPTQESWDWRYPYLTESKGIHLGPGSTKTINLITSYEIRRVYLDPLLSRHRGSIRLKQDSVVSTDTTLLEPLPYEQESVWIPPMEVGVIVDDLDSGFEVEQRRINTSRPSRIGPLGWVRMPQLDVELDRGLPLEGSHYMFEWDVPDGVWTRSVETQAYGKFRRTAVQAWVERAKPQLAFSANLPTSNVWKLEYHIPTTELRRDYFKDLTYHFTVSNGTQSVDSDFRADQSNLGWNTIGEFNLSAGEARLELVKVSKPGMVWADAIRWTEVETN